MKNLLANFRKWAEANIPAHLLPDFTRLDRSAFDTMQELCRNVGFREISSTEGVAATLNEFMDWWEAKQRAACQPAEMGPIETVLPPGSKIPRTILTDEDAAELLEKHKLLMLAAKAIGATEYGGPDDCRPPGMVLLNGVPTHYEGRGEFGYTWNPLDDDGDAFRLAVRCLPFHVLKYTPEDLESCNQDGLAATRLAIVRAAAEIGRAMP